MGVRTYQQNPCITGKEGRGMSGGHFDYLDSRLKGEIFGYTDKPVNVLEDLEISKLVWDVLDLLHEFDWYYSGDTCKETYLKAKAKFKRKWLGNKGIRIRRIIDEAIDDLRQELYETYGIASEDAEAEDGDEA